MNKLYPDLKTLIEHELLAEDHPDVTGLIVKLKPLKKRGSFTKPEFLEMRRWKSPRPLRWYSANTPRRIDAISREAFATAYCRFSEGQPAFGEQPACHAGVDGRLRQAADTT